MAVAITEQINNIRAMSQQVYERDTAKDREYRRLKAFNRIIVKSNEAKNQRELLQGILDACIDFVNFDLGGIYLLSEHTARIVATKFIPKNTIYKLDEICMNRPELTELFEFGKPQYIRNYDIVHAKTSKLLGGIKTLISVPILFNDGVKGCINIGSFNDRDITNEECDILRTLGKHLGHVLHRFEIEEELELQLFEVEAYAQELRASVEQYQDGLNKLELAHQQLDIERQNFKTLFNKIEDMIFVISLDGIIVAINDAVRNRLGYPNGQLIGQPITIVHDHNDRAEVIRVIKDMMNGDLKFCTLTLVTKDGEFVPVDTRVVKGLWDGKECIYGTSREVIKHA